MSNRSIEAIERRLKAWQRVVETGLPAEYADSAPRIVAQLESELGAAFGPEPIIPLTPFEEEIAQGIEAGTATTAGRGPQDESPVVADDAPKGGQ